MMRIPSPPRLGTLCRAWPLLLLIALPGHPALAGSGSVAWLPTPRTKAPSGLRLSIDNRWMDGNGYRPVRVRLSLLNGRPTPADRMVKVVLRPQGWYWGTGTPASSAWVELEQGKTYGETVIPSVNRGRGRRSVWKHGKMGMSIKELSDQVAVSTVVNGQWSEAAPTVLLIDSDAPPNLNNNGAARISLVASGASTPHGLPDVSEVARHSFARKSLPIVGLRREPDRLRFRHHPAC